MPVIKENSFFRIGWDLLIVLLIFISCTTIPFHLAFQHEVPHSTWVYIIDLLFLFDIFFNFHTSFTKHGIEVLDKKKIGRQYLRSRFAVDVVANFPLDLIFFIIAPDWYIFGLPLVLVLRLFRLLRVFRFFTTIRRWEYQHWISTAYLRITRFISIIILLIHWIACTWFLSAYIANFPTDSWVAKIGLDEAPIFDQYIRALYWSITTMTTVGYGDISPGRLPEYIIAMFVMLLGASMYAFIIGNVASLFSNLDAAKVQYQNRIEATTRYLRQRQIPHDLNKRIQNYYEYIWDRRRGIRDEALFNDLPPPLRLEVLLHLTHELLETVPLFKHCTPALRNILLEALKAHSYPPKVDIVRAGELGNTIYFVSKGEVAIIPDGKEEPYETLANGEYFGDLSLLLKEKRTASIHTLSFSEIFILESIDFYRIKKEYPEFTEVMKKMSSEKTEKMAALVLEGIIL